MSNEPEKYLPGRPCRDCEQTEPKVVGGVLMEPNGNSTIRQIVENVMMALGANNHDFRLRDKLIMENAHYIQRHSDALSASLERERVLRKDLSDCACVLEMCIDNDARMKDSTRGGIVGCINVLRAALAKTGGG